ncbi:ABC transporter permease [Sporomusa sphaeroides]|uniref:Glutathione transport system permease protein GsiC n=1 Tax=Sporomusa sphaeroides DSM 2875 TaxID=1337886 RepID=A0ABP2C5C4_9FIRM|nr:ABC transporter permease [Sporomusa sphaeroides]OLS55900.1 glutathione transport system permease protein GsiC [Sporomusa sphaeroides DSM 2875]CVK18901.1 Glutathione transport system permease protein GsiC [Sporomusa sphaeroides DSM 2875]
MNMATYVGRTLIRGVGLLIAVVIVTFVLVQASPIDPVEAYITAENPVSQEQREAIAAYWGLNDPPLERLGKWISALAHGDMGTSMYYRQPVVEVIQVHFMNSLMLMAVAWILSGFFGFALGVVAAAYQHTRVDSFIKVYCLLIASAPAFWLGLLILMVFAVWLGWFPIALGTPIGKEAAQVTFGDRLYHLVLPALTLAIAGTSQIALHTRQKLIDVLNSDYAVFATARGETRWQIVYHHGLRNILLPAVTLQFGSISELFGGSVLAENVFSYTGLGYVAVVAGTKLDLPLLLGIALCSGFFVFTGNLIANLLYPLIDPQIREGGDIA